MSGKSGISAISIIGGIFGCIVAYALIGYLATSMARESIHNNEGKVWNASRRANDNISRQEDLLIYATDNFQEAITKITAARDQYDQAVKDGDVNALATAAQNRLITVNAIVEAYPELNLGELQIGVQDEIAGSINRITTARDNLIDAQTAYNKWRIFFPFVPREDVLGQYEDPAADLEDSQLHDRNNPTAVPAN